MVLMSTLALVRVVMIPIDMLRLRLIVQRLGLGKYRRILELNGTDEIALNVLALTVKVGCKQTHISEL